MLGYGEVPNIKPVTLHGRCYQGSDWAKFDIINQSEVLVCFKYGLLSEVFDQHLSLLREPWLLVIVQD